MFLIKTDLSELNFYDAVILNQKFNSTFYFSFIRY